MFAYNCDVNRWKLKWLSVCFLWYFIPEVAMSYNCIMLSSLQLFHVMASLLTLKVLQLFVDPEVPICISEPTIYTLAESMPMQLTVRRSNGCQMEWLGTNLLSSFQIESSCPEVYSICLFRPIVKLIYTTGILFRGIPNDGIECKCWRNAWVVNVFSWVQNGITYILLRNVE